MGPLKGGVAVLPAAEFEVRLIRTLDDLVSGDATHAYERFVDQLSGFNRLSFSGDWLSVTAPAFTRSGETPFFVSVWRGHDIVAVAPFLLQSRGLGPARFGRLRFWGTGGLWVEYPPVSLLVVPGMEAEAGELVVESLRSTLSIHFDEISLPRTNPRDAFIGRLCSAFHVLRNVDHGDRVNLFGHHQHIDERLKGRRLRRFRNTERRLREDFPSFEMSTARRFDEALLDEIRTLHIGRQHELIREGRPRTSVFEDPVEEGVLRGMMRTAERRGGLRVYLQRIEGQLVAFQMCFAANRYVVAELTAMKKVPGYKYAASCLLRFMMLEEFGTHETEWVDFGFGEHDQKRSFSNTWIDLRSVTLVNHGRLASRVRQRALGGLRLARHLLRPGKGSRP